jgi:hypothetical protein
MMGISGDDTLMWINHFLFTISRNRPKIDMRKLIMKNEYAKEIGMVVGCRRLSFPDTELFGTFYTVFIDFEMREGITKLCALF